MSCLPPYPVRSGEKKIPGKIIRGSREEKASQAKPFSLTSGQRNSTRVDPPPYATTYSNHDSEHPPAPIPRPDP